MSTHLEEDGSFINSIIGEGTTFQGDLELNGLLRIDGDFSGTIRTDGKVLVGLNGRAECTVNAGTVVIGGIVKGNVIAREKVLILSTGLMIGNIQAPRLIAEEGVLMNGSFTVRQGDVGKLAGGAPAIGSGDGAKRNKSDSASREEEGEESKPRVLSGANEKKIPSWNG